MSIMNDEVYDDLHDEDDDEDEGDDAWFDHEIDSDIALDGFADRAMRHGRHAATWLLAGLLAEAAIFTGFGGIVAAVYSHSPWPGAAGGVIAMVLTLVNAMVIDRRWDRHHDRMKGVIEEAMTWRSDVQQNEQDDGGTHMQRYRDRVEEERIEALREELTWNIGPAPAFIAADDHAAIAAYERRNEYDDLHDSLDEQRDDEPESDNVPVVPAVRAWMERWANEKPVKRPKAQQAPADRPRAAKAARFVVAHALTRNHPALTHRHQRGLNPWDDEQRAGRSTSPLPNRGEQQYSIGGHHTADQITVTPPPKSASSRAARFSRGGSCSPSFLLTFTRSRQTADA